MQGAGLEGDNGMRRSIGVFILVLSAASFAASVLTGSSIHPSRGNTWVVVTFFAWEFFYYAYFWTASGTTPGMVLIGVQVVGQDGSTVGTRRGLVRTLAFPLSILLLGLGLLGILLGRDRRAHDVIADTAVVYCWDAREAPSALTILPCFVPAAREESRVWCAAGTRRIGPACRGA